MKLLSTKGKRQAEQNTSFTVQRRHILGKNSSFYVQEAYKTLRTNIRFYLSGEGCKKFCVTSGLEPGDFLCPGRPEGAADRRGPAPSQPGKTAGGEGIPWIE